ncbi:hypothetical protein ACFOG5_01070 [Pedobacter fastidiosus]
MNSCLWPPAWEKGRGSHPVHVSPQGSALLRLPARFPPQAA